MYEKEPQTESDFAAQKRDVLLMFDNYEQSTRDIIENYEFMTSQFLAERAKAPDCTPADLMASSRAKAWDAVTYLHLQYSAGLPIEHLRNFYPTALDYWEEYAKYDKAFDATPEAGGRKVPHLDLYDKDYWDALRLCCFAILFGHTNLLPRLCVLWDYGNDDMDGLLERLVAPYVPDRGEPPSECTRHLPYFKTLKIFAAAPEKRPAMMARYIDEWYVASRREPYYDSHTEGREQNHLGYWCFEAATISIVLDIDDSSYRDMQFYPKDLADFARRQTPQAAPASNPAARLRAEPNDLIPKTGWWHSQAKPNGQALHYFEAGQRFPDWHTTSYGSVIWGFNPNEQKEPPKK